MDRIDVAVREALTEERVQYCRNEHLRLALEHAVPEEHAMIRALVREDQRFRVHAENEYLSRSSVEEFIARHQEGMWNRVEPDRNVIARAYGMQDAIVDQVSGLAHLVGLSAISPAHARRRAIRSLMTKDRYWAFVQDMEEAITAVQRFIGATLLRVDEGHLLGHLLCNKQTSERDDAYVIRLHTREAREIYG